MSGKCDPESQDLWDEFMGRGAVTAPGTGRDDPAPTGLQRELFICCNVCHTAIKYGNTRVVFLNLSVGLNYCPECGRKLTP